MGYHHVALATADPAATHHFDTGTMCFELVEAVVAPTDTPGGRVKQNPPLEAPPSPVFHRARTTRAPAFAPSKEPAVVDAG